jgi:hypothetical protein
LPIVHALISAQLYYLEGVHFDKSSYERLALVRIPIGVSKINPTKVLLFLSIFVLSGLISACSPTKSANVELVMAPLSEMPAYVDNVAASVQQSYQFAVANPDILQEIPCYCGCGPAGHTSNYSCYVSSVDGDTIIFDNHAVGCSICVEITQDTMRLLTEGKSVEEIRTYVDQIYSKYGPSNMPQ